MDNTVSFKNRRRSERTTLVHQITALCWFNRWLKPVIQVRVVDISNHGMQLYSKDQLNLNGATMRIKTLDRGIRGTIVWQKPGREGYVCGFMVNEGQTISDEEIDLINELETTLEDIPKEL